MDIQQQTIPTHEQIAERAYILFQDRGSEPGHELEDWLQAEAELSVQQAVSGPEDVSWKNASPAATRTTRRLK
jgi:hypothetical protein